MMSLLDRKILDDDFLPMNNGNGRGPPRDEIEDIGGRATVVRNCFDWLRSVAWNKKTKAKKNLTLAPELLSISGDRCPRTSQCREVLGVRGPLVSLGTLSRALLRFWPWWQISTTLRSHRGHARGPVRGEDRCTFSRVRCRSGQRSLGETRTAGPGARTRSNTCRPSTYVKEASPEQVVDHDLVLIGNAANRSNC